MYSIREASSNDIKIIQKIAEETWWPTYSTLLSAEQIKYMLDNIYSAEVLKKTIDNKSQVFILITDEKGPQGFAAYGPKTVNPLVFKLHKIYIRPENHGKGYGKILINEVKERISEQECRTLDLNVKRDNPARGFYEKLGFVIIAEEDIPLGPYWLNDYVMRLEF